MAETWYGERLAPERQGHVEVDADASSSGGLVLRWELSLQGPVSLPSAEPGFHDGLWEHDVVELFLAPADERQGGSYVELEVGPAGHWLALSFSAVRERSGELRDAVPSLTQRLSGVRWTGEAVFPLTEIVAVVGVPPYRGLAAACLGASPDREYLCSPALPGPRPDFHQPSAWPRLG